MQLNVYIKIKSAFFIVLLLGSAFQIKAQSQRELEIHVQNSKVLLEQQKYTLAMTALLPAINAGNNFKNAPQALYLYSVAALKANKLKEANDQVQKILQEYQTWDNLDEARYVGANIAFEQQNFAKALTLLQDIKDPDFEADKSAIKQNYLERINNKAQLSALVQQFPEDKDVAVVYANKLINGWYASPDKNTLETIVSKFNLDKSKYTPKASAALSRKGQYNVAVLLPFPVTEKDPATIRKNQFITDLYSGMIMARDSLAKNNITINLFAYDAPSDTNKVKEVLNLPEMTGMDLIIGPVYKSANKIISRFAQQHQIIAINPLSEDISLIQNNPYLYLFQASLTSQGTKAADFAYDNFSSKSAVLVYDNTENGLEFARAYRLQYEKRGGKITAIKAVSPKSYGGTVYGGIDFSTVGHLLIYSDNYALAVNTISTLQRLSTKVPVITTASWLEINQLSLQQLDDQEIYFLQPKYVDSTLPLVREFKKDYVARFNIPPSSYTYTGFELLYYFGNILSRYGSKFNTALASEGAISGAFLQGINFTGKQDNQYVPLLKLENLQIMVANPVFK